MTKPRPATKQAANQTGFPGEVGGNASGAHPTSPAGMTQPQLRLELKEQHGVDMATSRKMTWGEQIEAVIQARKRVSDQDYDEPDEVYVGTDEDGADVYEPIDAEDDSDLCSECGGSLDDGEGYDGLCGNCADEATCKHGEDPDLCSDCDDEMLAEVDDEDDFQPIDPDPAVATAIARVNKAIADLNEACRDETPALINKQGIGSLEQAEAELDEVEQWLATVQTERDDFEAALPPALFIGMPGTLDYSFSGHAGTGPSGAERWMNCTASLGLSQAFLRNLSNNQQAEFANANTAARQGTTAHAAAEVEARVILGEMGENEAEHWLFELAINPPDGEEYDPEMASFITEYTDLVKQFVDDGHEVLIEQRVEAAIPLTAPLTQETRDFMGLDLEDGNYYIVPGSVDCGVLPTEAEPVLTVVDLKYGEGKDVDPVENPQGMIYALGLLNVLVERGYDLDVLVRIDIVIAQPRLGGIKSWSTTLDDLLTWQDDVLSPALTAALGLAPSEFQPAEDTCQWCAARGNCAALAAVRVEAASELFTALDDAEFGDGPGVVPADLDDDRLATLLAQITGLIDLHKDLKAEAQRRLYRGENVPGFVLVNYTPPRSWKDEAQEFFADPDNENLPVWKAPELVTPTQFVKKMAETEFKNKATNAKAREALAQAQFARLIEVPDKVPVVAKEGDRRSLWQGKGPDDMFDALPDEEG